MGAHLPFRATRIAVAILAVVVAPTTALGQAVIRGFVYDDSTGARLPLSAVMLVDPRTDAAVAHAKTDSLGQFSLKIERGVYQLAAVREGFSRVLSAPIPLADGELLTVRIPIAVNGDPTHKIGVLERVRAQGAGSGDARGSIFERRRSAAMGGLVYDRARLDQSSAATVGDFLSMVPGVSVRDTDMGGTVQMRRSGFMTDGPAGPCRVGWFIDGIRMDRPGFTDGFAQAFAATRLSEVDAIEVFKGLSELPAEFAAPDLRCGAVALWMKRG